jgi:hypothetical protein
VTKKKVKSTINGLPLDLIFEAVRFLPIRAAARLLVTSHDMHSVITNDATATERWYSNLITTNHPSLLHLSSHPSLDTSMKKLLAYVKCCTRTASQLGSKHWKKHDTNIAKRPDLSKIVVHCTVYVKVSEPGDTITCDTCTLVNPFGTLYCATCHRNLDYTNIGTEDVLFQTTAALSQTTMHFTYPPIAASVASQVETMLDPELDTFPNIRLSLCLFDTKTHRTFAQYDGHWEDMINNFDLQFSVELLNVSSSLTSHLCRLMKSIQLCFWVSIDFTVGATTGSLILHGEHDEIEGLAALEMLYLFSKSVDWSQVPALSIPSSISGWLFSSTAGQLPFVPQSSMVEAGRLALFALPNVAEDEPFVETIRTAQISISQLLEQVSFVLCVHRYSSHLSLRGSSIFHSELIASFDDDERALGFALPASVDETFNSILAFDCIIEIVAVNCQTNRMCQLVKYTNHSWYCDENHNESASEHNIARSLVGAVLKESCECQFTGVLKLGRESDALLKYQVKDRHLVGNNIDEGMPQDVPIMNAFLRMSFDEGGAGF